jgi:hypothetical protein
MSDVINVVIRARDEATKSLLSAGNAADALAEAQAEASRTGAALEQQAAETADALREQAAAAQEAAKAGPARGPDGRFLPKNGAAAGESTDAVAEAAAEAASAAAEGIKDMGEASDKADGSVKNMSNRVMTLRYNLADVAQQLAGGASPFLILLQQGPEIVGALGSMSEASTIFKAALGGSLPIIAGVAVAAASLVAAYSVLANATEEAAEATGRLGARMEETGARAEAAQRQLEGVYAAITALRKGNADAELAFKELTGEIDKHAAAATRSRRSLEEDYRAEELAIAGIIQKEKDVIAARSAALKASQEAAGSLRGQINALSDDEREAAQVEIANAHARLRTAQETSARLQMQKGEALALIDATEEYSRTVEEQGEAEKEANRARAEAAKRLAEMRREYDSLIKALEAFQDAERAASALGPVSNLIPAQAIDDLRALQAELDQLAPPEKTISDLQRVQLLLLDIERAAAEAGAPQVATAAAEQAEAAIRRLMAAGMKEAAASIEELGGIIGKLYADAVNKAAGAGRAIGQVLGGDLIGVLSDWLPKIAGPVGAAIGGALQGLTALGEMGPGQVSGQITGAVQGIAKGLTNLPALIVQLVPDLLTKALPDLIVALVGLIPRLAVALVIELPVAIVRGIVGWWRDIGGFRGIAASIADGVRTWWRETWDRVRAWLKDIFTPGDQGRGRRVSDARADDLRALQAAAMAVTDPRGRPGQPTDARTYSRRGAGPQPAGPTLVIQAASLHPDVVPATLRDLDRMTRPGGLRRGTTGLGGT